MNRPPEDRLAREERALDALLDAQPVPETPPGLAQRVLRATEAERSSAPAPARGPALNGWRWGGGVAAAAALVIWVSGSRDTGSTAIPAEPSPRVADAGARKADDVSLVAPGAGEIAAADSVPLPDPELLRDLELFEEWELLVTDDLDLLLAELDALDELLLESADGGEVEQG